MDFLLYLVIVIGFFFAGIIVGKTSSKIDGMFIVDDSNNDVTRWILDMRIDPKSIPCKKEVRLKVVKKSGEVV